MNFEESLKAVGLAEGAYTNDPRDSGGETICGLARNKNPDLKIWGVLDAWKKRGNSGAQLDKLARGNPEFMALVKATYRGAYWQSVRCDELPALLRYPMFSCCVNCGKIAATKILQRAAGVSVDGKLGNITLNAVRQAPINDILEKFYMYWGQYYNDIVEIKPEKQVFLNGWHNRIENVKKTNHA